MPLTGSSVTSSTPVLYINNDALDKVQEHIADAKAKGADVILGGESHDAGGNFFKTNQDLVPSGLQGGLKGHAVWILVVEMFLSVDVFAIDPH